MSFFWVGHFEFFFRKKKFFFCFIPMKISPNLYGRMDGLKFWFFTWFPENSLLSVILRYTVYVLKPIKKLWIHLRYFMIINTSFWQHSRLANLPRFKSHALCKIQALGTLDFRFSEKVTNILKNISYLFWHYWANVKTSGNLFKFCGLLTIS